MNEKRKRIIKIAMIVVVVLLIIHPLIPIPIRISTTAVEIRRDDPYHFIEREVSVRGWYRVNRGCIFSRVNGNNLHK